MRVPTMIANYVSHVILLLFFRYSFFPPPWHSLCRAFTQTHSHKLTTFSTMYFSSSLADDVNKRCLKPDISHTLCLHTKHWYVTNHVFLVPRQELKRTSENVHLKGVWMSYWDLTPSSYSFHLYMYGSNVH